MRNKLLIIMGVAMLSGMLACTNYNEQQQTSNTIVDNDPPLVNKVLTAEEQAALTPDRVIEILKEGNEHYVGDNLTERDHSAMIRNSTYMQYPKAIILSCIDSRVPVEDVFDRGIGDLFVARVAGNFANTDILGSMEYACKVSGSKVILVLGHEHCGAIKAAIDDVELGNITAMLANIKPAIDMVDYPTDQSNSGNKEYVHLVCESNVVHTMEYVRLNSPILQQMESDGEIKIVGAIYNMTTGKVSFLED